MQNIWRVGMHKSTYNKKEKCYIMHMPWVMMQASSKFFAPILPWPIYKYMISIVAAECTIIQQHNNTITSLPLSPLKCLNYIDGWKRWGDECRLLGLVKLNYDVSSQAHDAKDPTHHGDPLVNHPKIKGFKAITPCSGVNRDTITPRQ